MIAKNSLYLLSIILLSVVIRIFFIHPTFSDENFYFNVGKNILEGKAPYNDFFFAHPPLQVYVIALFFKILGASFFVGKLLPLISSSICVFLVYLISKELKDESSFISVIIFLISPAFIVFSTQGYGMWEASLFVMLSIYLILKNKPIESSVTFLIAVLFRYFSLFYLPFLLILIIIKKYKLRRFLISFLILSIIAASSLILIFGENIIRDTVIFQVKNTGVKASQEYFTFQYLSIGLFFIFLGLLSAVYAFRSKDKTWLLFSLYPVIADVMIFFLFKEIAYHYSLINLPLYAISIGKAFKMSKDKIVQLSIFIILALSILSNIPTIDFYLNPSYAERYYSIENFIENRTSPDDSIFGEPTITNYVSFVTARRISSDYLDSFPRHLIFEGEQNIVKNLERDKPKIIIDSDNYFLSNPYFNSFMQNNYKFEKRFEGIPNYSLYVIK
jgi:Gpi18-like mannosyltransferase